MHLGFRRGETQGSECMIGVVTGANMSTTRTAVGGEKGVSTKSLPGIEDNWTPYLKPDSLQQGPTTPGGAR